MSNAVLSPAGAPSQLTQDNQAKKDYSATRTLTKEGAVLLDKAPDKVFALQSKAWFNMINLIVRAQALPIEQGDFVEKYGKFNDEANIEHITDLLTQLNNLGNEYGNPQAADENSAAIGGETAPEPIYLHALWLVNKIEAESSRIANNLEAYFTDDTWKYLGDNVDEKKKNIQEAFDDGLTKSAKELAENCASFLTKSDQYFKRLFDVLDATGPHADSLTSYLEQSVNIETEAEQDEKDLTATREALDSSYDTAKAEFIGFIVGACTSPLLIIVPIIGPVLAVAGIVGFSVEAKKEHDQMVDLGNQLTKAKADVLKKTKLISDLKVLKSSIVETKNQGDLFRDAISKMKVGFENIEGNLNTFIKGLTEKDLVDAATFVDVGKIKSATESWREVGATAVNFVQNGQIVTPA